MPGCLAELETNSDFMTEQSACFDGKKASQFHYLKGRVEKGGSIGQEYHLFLAVSFSSS